MKKEILERILSDKKTKQAVTLATDLDTGNQTLVYSDNAEGPDKTNEEILKVARATMQDDKSKLYNIDDRKIFMEVFSPPLRMLIVGAVHIAQPLSRMALLTGYDVTLIDPRSSFANNERFPGFTLNNNWPDEAVKELDPDKRTAIVTLTHDPKLDDPALEIAIKSAAFYIGSLGSKKTHAARVERLKSAGFTISEINRIKAPIGLNISSVTPSEIAVSIMAEVIETLHTKVEEKAVA